MNERPTPVEGKFALVSHWRGPVVRLGKVNDKTSQIVGGGRLDNWDVQAVFDTEEEADAALARHRQVIRDGQEEAKRLEAVRRDAALALDAYNRVLRQRAWDAARNPLPIKEE